MRIKPIIIYPAVLIASIVIFNCSKDKSVNDAGLTHEDIRGDCLNSPMFSPDAGSGYLALEVYGNDLHVCHNEAYYQCCLGYVVDYEIDGFNIGATESDSAGQCHCDCLFDLRSILYDLESGMYTVTLTGIEGDIVGIDSAYVGE